MDPVWQNTPYDIIRIIAFHSDIDTRRAMGFRPLKLPLSDIALPLGRINVETEPGSSATIVNVSFENAGIHFYKIIARTIKEDWDTCAWYFNQSQGKYWMDGGREYKMQHTKDGGYTILSGMYGDNGSVIITSDIFRPGLPPTREIYHGL